MASGLKGEHLDQELYCGRCSLQVASREVVMQQAVDGRDDKGGGSAAIRGGVRETFDALFEKLQPAGSAGDTVVDGDDVALVHGQSIDLEKQTEVALVRHLDGPLPEDAQDSLFAQQNQRIDRQRALSWDPRSQQPQQ